MREEARGWVYILASARFGTLYTGSTRDLVRRVYEHREGLLPGFTRKYGVTRLVWFEPHVAITDAYRREQLLKRWRRAWKIALIEEKNPYWEDMYPAIAGTAPPRVHFPFPLLLGHVPALDAGRDPGSSDEAS
jgi:putative endonuclease